MITTISASRYLRPQVLSVSTILSSLLWCGLHRRCASGLDRICMSNGSLLMVSEPRRYVCRVDPPLLLFGTLYGVRIDNWEACGFYSFVGCLTFTYMVAITIRVNRSKIEKRHAVHHLGRFEGSRSRGTFPSPFPSSSATEHTTLLMCYLSIFDK